MLIQLVKDYDKRGEVSYYVKVDGEPIPGSTRYEFYDAMQTYEVEKKKHTMARTEVLIQENI